jgi:hypothetical protein
VQVGSYSVDEEFKELTWCVFVTGGLGSRSDLAKDTIKIFLREQVRDVTS